MFKYMLLPLGFIRKAGIIRLGFIVINLIFLSVLSSKYIFFLSVLSENTIILVHLNKNVYLLHQ